MGILPGGSENLAFIVFQSFEFPSPDLGELHQKMHTSFSNLALTSH